MKHPVRKEFTTNDLKTYFIKQEVNKGGVNSVTVIIIRNEMCLTILNPGLCFVSR